MLTSAGYDPTLVPQAHKMHALWVAWAFADRLYDARDIATACDMSLGEVRKCITALRNAAKLGTIVG